MEVVVHVRQMRDRFGLGLHDFEVIRENTAHVEDGAVAFLRGRGARHTAVRQGEAPREAFRGGEFPVEQSLGFLNDVSAVAVVADDVAFQGGGRFLRDRRVAAFGIRFDGGADAGDGAGLAR